jgi:hypothetical protein
MTTLRAEPKAAATTLRDARDQHTAREAARTAEERTRKRAIEPTEAQPDNTYNLPFTD